MPNIPDAASYVAPLGQGFQIGTQWQAQRERQREALANEALAQQQQGIAQAQEGRTQQEFQQGQDASRFLLQRFQQRQGEEQLKAHDQTESQTGSTPYVPKDSSEILREIYPEALARFPGSALEKVLPGIQRQVLTPAQQALIDARNQQLLLRSDAIDNAKTAADRRAFDRERMPQHNAAAAAGISLYPNGMWDENGKAIPPDPEGVKNLESVQKTAKQYGLTPAVIRNSKAVVEASGLPEEDQGPAFKIVAANGGKFPTIPPAELNDISAQDNIVRSTRKLSDILDSYKGSLGPANFIAALTGKYVGSDPELNRLNQTYSQLKRGEVVKYAGKTITPSEINLVLEAIGSPNDPRFRQQLGLYQQAQTESLAEKINSVKARGIHYNPAYQELVKNMWGKNLSDSVNELGKRGVNISTPYQFDGGGAPAPADSGKAEAYRSKYNY
jgi:hypothetical protein